MRAGYEGGAVFGGSGGDGGDGVAEGDEGVLPPGPVREIEPAGEGREGVRAAVPSEERLARALLTRVADPGDEVVGRALAERGLRDTVSALRSGRRLPGAGPERTRRYALRAADADPVADLTAVHRAGGRFLCPGDGEWPGQLDDLGAQRPFGLWVRGRPSLRLWALRSVAVVGSRNCTDYGHYMAVRLGAGLAGAGWVVVSGAAYGVDGAVHTAVLGAGGATVGVLANGVDVAYPPGNTRLIDALAERGLVVTELPPGTHPTRWRFVLRNRVIAALTRGTVVVEARYRSGSLITARRAAGLGRITMGVPGPCTSGHSEGVHELLRTGGAAIVTDAAEVVELVGRIGADLAPERRGPVLPRDRLRPGAARVLEAMPARGHADEHHIAESAGTTETDTLARLHELQALGFVAREDGRWCLVRTARGRPG
ncbi:DNA-processing protein DprA [Actinacidiphila yeochonensis]|uniref:DNA-processing protein DprA n=1 Tax=Actinacidiphila yeochonensis TaxID=89050 RepID=UPI003898EE96